MLHFIKRSFLIFSCLLCCALAVSAQGFRLMRYDEDYAGLKDSAATLYNRIKYLPITKHKNTYLSFGGEARLEYVAFDNEDWGRLGIGHNNFLLQRYDLHADLHAGADIRFFAQIRSALQGGRKNGSRPVDQDELNIQNLFVDYKAWKQNDKSLLFRLGRQELDYGSGRLISVREGPNVRLSFTGAKVMYKTKSLFIDAFVMAADTINPGRFDNRRSNQVNLWGTYSKIIIQRSGNLDLYYLGIRRDASQFEEGFNKELRHTIGTRLWKSGGGFIYNLEAAYQFGKFGDGKISAWTGSAELGYSFEQSPWKPTINLRNDYISGDANKGDGKLNTFNPIYPKGGYFGFSPQVGPVNLIDIHPYGSLLLSDKLTLQFDVVFNWRYSLQDGVYRPSGTFNLGGATSQKRYIGTAYLASAIYGWTKFISLNAGAQYFKTGAFIDDIIPGSQNGLFINGRIVFKF
ncbi:alginate export family protein [Pedobacter duraquae]|uniref:Alginate export protein n=1 Tax=Pedobacter duraquae TaxID=425511 RepID=A0A4R6IPS1_9SPHI|nr:alginate export family protein [Pedobacter duraquae]TDO24300.1 alginate export protein [Pedobacter duraquae]